MLRIIQRCLGRFKPATPRPPASETTVLLVRVPIRLAAGNPPTSDGRPGAEAVAVDDHPQPAEQLPSGHSPVRSAERVAVPHRARAVAAKEPALRDLQLFSPQLLSKLRRAGLRSTQDLLAADPDHLVQRLGGPAHWAARIRRGQRAIRFSGRFSDMTPHEALLLFAAHRRTRTRLAAESAGVLKRDLERLLLSSRGQKLAAGRTAPEIARVRLWIHQAQRRDKRLPKPCQSPDHRCGDSLGWPTPSALTRDPQAPKSVG